MNVLTLVASPRKLGNSEIVADQLLAALPDETGKRMIRLPDLQVDYCKACYACLPQGKDCVLNDDLNFLLDNMEWADAVAIVTPCYFLGAHTSLKVIQDRMLPLISTQRRLRGKKCVIVVLHGVEGWQGYAYEQTLALAQFLGFRVVGSVIARAANPGEAAVPAVRVQVQKLAQCLIEPDCQQFEVIGQQMPITCPHCGSSLLQLFDNGHVHCVLCNSDGHVGHQGDQYTVDMTSKPALRFSAAGMDEHARLLTTIKQQFIDKRADFKALREQYRHNDWWVKRD